MNCLEDCLFHRCSLIRSNEDVEGGGGIIFLGYLVFENAAL